MNRRKHDFSNHPIQRKYLKLIFVAMFLPTLLTAACLYYVIWQTVAQELAVPELIAQALFPALQRVNLILLFGIPFIFGAILFFAFRLTHRLAGPIYRIEKTLSEIVKTGNFSRPIHIRKTDDLHTLVGFINQAIEKASGSREK